MKTARKTSDSRAGVARNVAATNGRGRARVLVVLAPDGFCEVFALPEVSALVVSRLAVGPAEEVLADEFLDASLPRPYRELYWPNRLRAVGQCRRVTAQQELDRRHLLHLVRGLVDVGKNRQLLPAAIAKARRAAG